MTSFGFRFWRWSSRLLVACLLLGGAAQMPAAEKDLPPSTAALADLSPAVLAAQQREEAAGAIERDIRRRSAEVNAKNRALWAKIENRQQWEAYRDERITKLRQSLGDYPDPSRQLNVRITGTIDGEGFQIQNVIYESRPGQWVPGNLYVPSRPGNAMPGILIAHAHHRDKPQSELQDMGMTWARAGCLVLVIDQVGYGERRNHPFHTDADYPSAYRTSRQDYYFRFDSGVQLQLIGDSLMGWMVWDQMRGVDLLLTQKGIDPGKIIILGAVAGGGDPAGVTAALDSRIACCVPFNFGGPQPESRYPLPEDAEESFNLLGGSYWDSTRGLRLGGRDDFLHWVIVGSTAPRYLIHAHEFSWDEQHDPVWRRYQRVWGDFYGAAGRLGVAHGKGTLRQQAPAASHCTNIGHFHRRMIHPLFERWFGIKVREEDEYSAPRPAADLVCLTPEVRSELQPQSLSALMTEVAEQRIAAAREQLLEQSPDARRKNLRQRWSQLLGPCEPAQPPMQQQRVVDQQPVAGARVERIALAVEPELILPILLLVPEKSTKPAVIVGVSQAGKEGFLSQRSADISRLLAAGYAVALPDVRGTGEGQASTSRGATSGATNLSVNVQLFGETLVGQRLRDLRAVMQYLRTRDDLNSQRLALWGDSFAQPNPADTNFKLPRGIDGWPREPEPLGGLLAMLGGLFEDNVQAVYVGGGLNHYRGVLEHFAVLVPHDACVPGQLTAGDLADLAGGLAPRPMRLAGLVDHLNRPVPLALVQQEYATTQKAYGERSAAVSFGEARDSAAQWLAGQLK